MDSEQFAQFLSVQQAQQEQIFQILALLVEKTKTSTSSTQNESTSSVTNACITTTNIQNKIDVFKNFNIEKFNPEGCRVEDYIDFFETKCSIYNINDDSLKKDLILNCFTPEIFREVKTSLTPKFDTSTYVDVRTKLMDLYRIKRTRYRALTEFWCSIRDNNESMEHYANRLKDLSKDCGYDDSLLERQLRDRFATGLNHPELETDLKQKWPDLLETREGETKEVTFLQIFLIAQSREQAEQDTPSTSVKRINKNMSKSSYPRSPTYKSQRKMRSDQCFRCGKHDKHDVANCPAKNHTCEECNTTGHFENCCIKSGRAYIIKDKVQNRRHKLQRVTESEPLSSNDSSDDSNENDNSFVYNMKGKSNKDCKRIDAIINGEKCTMDWDPGSAYSIISTQFWKKIGAPALTQAPKLKAYCNNKLKSKGLAEVTVELEGKQKILPAVVMKNADPMLFGLQWSETFEMEFPKAVYSIKCHRPTTLKQVLNNHAQLFDGKLGKVNDYQINIHVTPEAVPVHLPARPIKFGIKKKIESELDRLVSEGIIEEVDPNLTPIEWATPTVNVMKPNGDIRICGDYRSTLNPVLVKHLHPIPLFDHLRQKLTDGKIFSKIDLKDAYLQFAIAPESKKYLTLATHKGYFQYNRMPFGISTAPSIFQHYLDKLLGNLSNVAVYFDDIAVTGKNTFDHLQTLSVVFDRLQQAGLKVNLKKCSFLQQEIEYLGHKIDQNGIRPTEKKLEAITKAAEPTNSKELRSFLGLVNFYERFIPHLHGLCADLHTLTSERRAWSWTAHESKVFEATKRCIAASKPLVAFDESKAVFLACDASEKGVGAVLFHKNGDIEQPIAFASRKLRSAESKYSVIDREALAILFGVKKFDQYLRGTKFTLVTDHKPLIHILGPQRNLPKLANNRLVRWALIIGSYDYDICYRKGINNTLADCLSRLPHIDAEPSETERLVHRIELHLLQTKTADLHLTEEIIKDSTIKDTVLSKVLQFLKTGWREVEYTSDLKHYFRKRNELSVENKIILWQGRMVIPSSLRQKVLTYLHQGHPGISAMKALTRFYVWWPSLDEDIDNFVKMCNRCQANRPHNPELPVFSWSIPENVWERVHIDFAGPFEDTYWLVLCDALSKWIEVRPMKRITTRSLCSVLDDIFCTFGWPRMIVSDNGPQLTSSEFKDYCKSQGILHVTSSPYHPRTNGLAERLVRTFKSRMASCEGIQCKRRLMEFLFTYRNTPHSTTGKSPAQMMFGRQLNCLLSNIRPDKRRNLQYQQIKANINENLVTPNFGPGENVFVRTRQDKLWQPGSVTARKGKYSYIITTPSGKEIRRHSDHIRSRIPSPTPPISTETCEATASIPLGTSGSPASHSSIGTHTAETPIVPETSTSSSSPIGSSFNTPNSEVSSSSSAAAPLRRSQRVVRPPRRLIDEY